MTRREILINSTTEAIFKQINTKLQKWQVLIHVRRYMTDKKTNKLSKQDIKELLNIIKNKDQEAVFNPEEN